MNPPAGAHCLTALPKPLAHSRLMLPDSILGCVDRNSPLSGALPSGHNDGTILGSAWGLLAVLVDGYVTNRIGFTKSNWQEQPSDIDLPQLA